MRFHDKTDSAGEDEECTTGLDPQSSGNMPTKTRPDWVCIVRDKLCQIIPKVPSFP